MRDTTLTSARRQYQGYRAKAAALVYGLVFMPRLSGRRVMYDTHASINLFSRGAFTMIFEHMRSKMLEEQQYEAAQRINGQSSRGFEYQRAAAKFHAEK